VLFVFGHHAREWVPPEGPAVAADVLDAYANSTGLTYSGKSYTAADVHQIVNTIFVVPREP
jgi:hypothetical protein